MDHQQNKKLKLAALAILFTFAVPLKGEEKAIELKNAISTLEQSEMPGFIDKLWALQDDELFSHVLKEANSDLSKYFKNKLGLMKPSEARDKIVILVLRAPQRYWVGNPPSSGSGSIELAMRRSVIETITTKLVDYDDELSFEDLNKEEKRLLWASKIEEAIASDSTRTSNSESETSKSLKTSETHQAGQGDTKIDSGNTEAKPDEESTRLRWIIAAVVLLLAGIILFLFKKLNSNPLDK
jgi:hypothetical protein